jgi:FkbM family methyltransferase
MTPEELKPAYDELQTQGVGKMTMREGITIDVGLDDYPLFGYEFFAWRSPEMVQEMDAFIKYAKGKTCFLDIGAFHGVFAQVFTAINEKGMAYAFEPYHEPFNMLSKVVKDKPIVIFQAALSDNSGRLKLYESDGHLVSKEIGNEVEVPAITGDAFCFGRWPNIMPDFIKVDCEGMELKVLHGLSNVIFKHRPTILLELHYSVLSEEEVIGIVEFLSWYKYVAIDIEKDLPVPLSALLLQKQGEKRIILK